MIEVGTRIRIKDGKEEMIFNEIIDFDFEMPTEQRNRAVALRLIDEYKRDGYFTITSIIEDEDGEVNWNDFYVNNTQYWLYRNEFTVIEYHVPHKDTNLTFSFSKNKP